MAPVALATVAEVDARIVLIQAPIRWASRPSTPSCSVSWSPWSASATLAQAGSRAWCAGRPSRVDLLGGQKLPITVARVRDRRHNREVPFGHLSAVPSAAAARHGVAATGAPCI